MDTRNQDITHDDNTQGLLDQLRSTWNEIETPPPFRNAETKSRRISSRRDKLLRYYTRLFAIAIVWVGISVPIMKEVGSSVTTGLCLSAFFLIMAIMIGLQKRRVEALDFGSLTSAELLDNIARLQRLRTLHIIIGCITGIPLLAVLLHSFAVTDIWMFAGGCAGLCAGATIGIINNLHTRRMIREIRSELED